MSGDRHRLVLKTDFDDTTIRALKPELESTEDLSDAQVVERNLMVYSDDLPSLRASLNGWVRLLTVAKEAGTTEKE